MGLNAKQKLAGVFKTEVLEQQNITWAILNQPMHYIDESFIQIDIEDKGWIKEGFKLLIDGIYFKDESRKFYQKSDGSEVEYEESFVFDKCDK